jgi:methylmalonyl-CoA mutase cobalamin-binding subunit
MRTTLVSPLARARQCPTKQDLLAGGDHNHECGLCHGWKSALGSLHENTAGAVVVLATLPNEPHGLGLEMVALYLATGGASPRVIGVSTPKDQIVRAAHAHQAAAVGLSIVPSSDLLAAASEIRALAPQLPRNTVLWLGGSGATSLPPIEGARIVATWDDLDDVLRALLTMGGRSP